MTAITFFFHCGGKFLTKVVASCCFALGGILRTQEDYQNSDIPNYIVRCSESYLRVAVALIPRSEMSFPALVSPFEFLGIVVPR